MEVITSGIFSRIIRLPGSRVAVPWALLALAGSVFGQLSVTGYNGASASISSNGAWTVSAAQPAWKFGGSAGAPAYSLRANTGTDNLGDFQELAFDYSISSNSRTGSIRLYQARPVVIFSQIWNNTAPNVSPFPVFTSYPSSLSHLSFIGEFAGADFTNLGNDSPWVYFDGSANTFIVSAASDFMTAATTVGAGGSIAAGISSQIATIPAGMTHRTALVFGQGINQTFIKWGQALTDLTGKQRPANDADVLLKQLSYWTDNGATYYYNPGGPSYSATLESVKAEFDAKGVPLGSLQLDSWWYPKGPDTSWSSHGGIWTYTGSPDLFQPDLATFRTTLGAALITHSRWIDAKSPYRSQYTISGNVATDPRYWEDIATYLQSSGVKVYEQDWLGDNAQANFNLVDSDAFLGNMAASMAKRGLNIQYCMALPKHFLESTNYSNVTTIRTSQDRFVSARWASYFYSNRFASAIGLWPFSDVFMSPETNNLIAATLSAGPLGVGDELGSVSAASLLKAVRADGVIVKPDVAATPLDSVYINDAQGIDVPMVASTYSDFGGGMRANYIFAFARGSNTNITIQPVDYGIAGSAYLYDYLNGAGVLIDAKSNYTLDLTGGAGYYILVPLGKTGIGFLGDRGHFVTLGKKRVATLADTGRIDVVVNFAPGEISRTLFGYSPAPVIATALAGSEDGAVWDPTTQIFSVNVRPAGSGTAHIRIVQSFATGDGNAASAGCGLRCGNGDPLPGRNK